MVNREHVAHAALQLYNLELPVRVAKNLVAQVIGLVPVEVQAVRSHHELLPQMVLGNHQETLDSQIEGPVAGLTGTAGPARVPIMHQGLIGLRSIRPPGGRRGEWLAAVVAFDLKGLEGAGAIAAPMSHDNAQMPIRIIGYGTLPVSVWLNDRVQGTAHLGFASAGMGTLIASFLT